MPVVLETSVRFQGQEIIRLRGVEFWEVLWFLGGPVTLLVALISTGEEQLWERRDWFKREVTVHHGKEGVAARG